MLDAFDKRMMRVAHKISLRLRQFLEKNPESVINPCIHHLLTIDSPIYYSIGYLANFLQNIERQYNRFRD